MPQCRKCGTSIGHLIDNFGRRVLNPDPFYCNECINKKRDKVSGRSSATSIYSLMLTGNYSQIDQFISKYRGSKPNPNVTFAIKAFCADIFFLAHSDMVQNILVVGSGAYYLLIYILSKIGLNITFLDMQPVIVRNYSGFANRNNLNNFETKYATFGEIKSNPDFHDSKNKYDLIIMFDLAGGMFSHGIKGWADDIIYFLKPNGGYLLFPKGVAHSFINPGSVLYKLKELRRTLRAHYGIQGIFKGHTDNKISFSEWYEDDSHYLYLFKNKISNPIEENLFQLKFHNFFYDLI